MEIRIPVLELTKTLNVMHGVVQKKNTMPILSNVLLEANNDAGGTLVLSATDLDVGVRMAKSCNVVQEGAITVSARSLLDISKMLPGPDATLILLPNRQVEIRSGRTKAKLNAISAEEFPKLPSFEGVTFHDIDTELFSSMIQKTLYSVSQDENRYSLTGVFFEPQPEKPGCLSLIATDGHRLSKVEKVFEGVDFSDLPPLIIPRKGLMELLRLLENEQAGENRNFKLGFTDKQAIACGGKAIIFMRLIDGKFPDYNQVIPKLSDKILRSSRSDFLVSLRRVSVLANDKNQSLCLSSKNGEMTVSCFNPEVGEVSDDVPIEYNGPDIEIGFNARYIIDALSSLSDKNIMIKFTDPLSPTLLTGMTDESHQCVIMPMRM